MPKSLFARCVELCAAALLVAGAAETIATPAQAQDSSLLQQAIAAEAAYRYDLAIDRLHMLSIEHPRTEEALTGRLRLARLLALSGDLASAILQCQAVRDLSARERPERRAALDLATTLARRLRARAGPSLYAAVEMLAPRGLSSVDEPSAVVIEGRDGFVLVDQGAKRLVRVTGETTSAVTGIVEPTAATTLGDGALVAGGRNGLASLPPGKPLPGSGTWGGKPRPLRKIRALAANSRGDLFVVDRDFDGVLRCGAAAASCVPWGPPGKARTVKVGPSDFVVVLDDRQQTVRVLDDSGKQVAGVGPTLGSWKIEKIADIGVDAGYALYLLDEELSRVHVGALRVAADGRFAIDAIGSVTVPAEGDRALRNPAAIGVATSGTLVIAGRSSPRLLRLR